MDPHDSLRLRLAAAAADIRRHEALAHEALHQRGDKAAHIQALVAKCETLAALPEDLAPLLEDADPALGEALKDMARRADEALGLESPFYMLRLLYAEDAQPGDPNELERAISRYCGDAG